MTSCGVSLLFLANTSRITIASASRYIEDAPCVILIGNPQLVTSPPDRGHRAGMRETEILAILKPPKQEPGFDSRVPGERQRLNFAVEPNERLLLEGHDSRYVRYDIIARVTKAAASASAAAV